MQAIKAFGASKAGNKILRSHVVVRHPLPPGGQLATSRNHRQQHHAT